MVETSSYEERMKELEIEYNEFLETKRGQEWKEHWKNEIGSDSCGDFGDYLYDFYPEMLMQENLWKEKYYLVLKSKIYAFLS